MWYVIAIKCGLWWVFSLKCCDRRRGVIRITRSNTDLEISTPIQPEQSKHFSHVSAEAPLIFLLQLDFHGYQFSFCNSTLKSPCSSKYSYSQYPLLLSFLSFWLTTLPIYSFTSPRWHLICKKIFAFLLFSHSNALSWKPTSLNFFRSLHNGPTYWIWCTDIPFLHLNILMFFCKHFSIFSILLTSACPICWCLGPPSSLHLISNKPSEDFTTSFTELPWPSSKQVASRRAPLTRSPGPQNIAADITEITRGA